METPRSQGFSRGQGVRREVSSEAKPWAAASIEAGRWGGRVAYERVVRVPESRYGAPGFGRWGCLRAGFREGSGAGVRAALECVERGSLAGHIEGCPVA